MKNTIFCFLVVLCTIFSLDIFANNTFLEVPNGNGAETSNDLIPSNGHYLNGLFTIQQKSTGRYLDAHVTNDRDYSIVTRTAQNNSTQKWIVKHTGNNIYTLQQQSTSRYMDAHESQNYDYSLVTRTAQNNNSQKWILKYIGNNTYTILHKSTRRYMDAHVIGQGYDYSVVTRTAQNNNTQKWVFKFVSNK